MEAPQPGSSKKEWMAYYRSLNTRQLRQIIGQSMGLPTGGSRNTLLKRMEERHAKK